MQGEYSIQFVSKVTGINSHTIRAWEKRYKAVVPHRNETGRRLFSRDQLERLKMLNDLVQMGNNISDIAKLDDSSLEELHKTYSKEKTIVAPRASIESIDLNSMLQNLILALNAYKLDIISHELEKARNSMDVRGFALNVLSPLMQEVGARCAAGKLSVAQEHALSAIIKFHVGNILFDTCNQHGVDDKKIIFTTPEGEMHEFGILIGALLCKHYNLPFFYLGTSLPVDALIQCLEQINVSHAIIGVSKNMETVNPNAVNKYVIELDQNINSKTKIWIGGFTSLSSQARSERVDIIPSLQALDFELSRLAGKN